MAPAGVSKLANRSTQWGQGRVVSLDSYASRPGEYALLTVSLPGRPPEPAGVLLLDPQTNELYVKTRRDWTTFATDDDAEVLQELENDLLYKSREMGGEAVLSWLEQDASQTVQVTEREAISVRAFDVTLQNLYREHIPSRVLPFQTHLPRYSLSVAAGPFLTNPEDIQAEEWIEAPADLQLDETMFLARIQGHSMEPRIPDGCLCVFRRDVVGSRNGRLVLVRNSELADDNQYTVKRYRSEKIVHDDGFVQSRIRLESLNPAYPSWDLDEDDHKYQVVGEFVRVLE